MPEAVLITGAAGFVGRAVVAALAAAGRPVIGTYRGAEPPAREGVRWVRCDLADRAAVERMMATERPAAMIALAWHMGPGNMAAAENYRWIGHSVDLLFAFAQAGGQRVVFCGSCAEYDWSGVRALSEAGTPLAPASDYGAAKAGLFRVFGPLCDRLGLSGAWARPFFIYGPGEAPKRLAADVTISLLRGREALCTHGRQKRDYLHVADVASALVALLGSDLQGAVNIGSGEATALADLVGEIGRQTGREELIRLGAREAPAGEAPIVLADTARLARELGWTPEFDLATGIADTVAWWRAELARETEAQPA